MVRRTGKHTPHSISGYREATTKRNVTPMLTMSETVELSWFCWFRDIQLRVESVRKRIVSLSRTIAAAHAQEPRREHRDLNRRSRRNRQEF